MINVGIIGAGSFGMKRARACRASSRARLAAIADIDPAACRSAAAALQTVPLSPDELIGRADIDVVIVSTPNKFHFPAIRQCLEAGKHVLSEKPLAISLQEAEELVRLAGRSLGTLKVSSNHRYFQEIAKAKEMTDQGVIGELLTFTGRIGHNGESLQKRWNVRRDLSGGGTLIDNGWHVIDLARWFMGGFSGVAGVTSNVYWKDIDVEDSATVTLTDGSGRMANIISSWRTFSGYLYVELNGTEGFIIIDSRFPGKTETPLLCMSRRNGGEVFRVPMGSAGLNSIEREIECYLAAIEEGRAPEPSAADGLEIMKIITRVYRQGRPS